MSGPTKDKNPVPSRRVAVSAYDSKAASKANATEVPDVIDVLGHDIRVNLSSEDEMKMHAEIGEHLWGVYIEWQQLIRLREDMAPGPMRETLLHELTHAVDQAAVLGLSEEQVHFMARGLLTVLRSNPDLVAYLTGD